MANWFLKLALCRLAQATMDMNVKPVFLLTRLGQGRALAAACLAVFLGVAGAPALAQEDAWAVFSINGVEAYNRGDFVEALEGFSQALVRARSFEHSDQRLITSLSNLGMVYSRMGFFDKAEPMYQEAIRIQTSILRRGHPDLSATLTSLADLYMGQERWSDALPLLTQALEIREAAAGHNHPFTALVVFTLGEVALAQNNWEQAVVMFSRVLVIRRQSFGPVHQSLIYPLTRLGVSLHALGDLDQAEISFTQALAIWSTVPLPVSPEYLMTLKAAAELFRETGQADRAQNLEATAAEIRELL